MRRTVPATLLFTALFLTACGGNDEAHSTNAPEPAPAPAVPAVGGTFELRSGKDGVPPVRIEVVARGTGIEARDGDRVVLHYVGTLTNGEPFDSSRERDDPFTFRLGRGEVIPGWDLVVSHMQVGDRWVATIPHQLAYGERGYPGSIPPRSDLVFDMELLGVR